MKTPLGHSRLTSQAYKNVIDLLNSALESPTGIDIPCDTVEEATALRHRLNKVRTLDRNENYTFYKPGDEFYGCSRFDKLQFIIKDATVLIRPHKQYTFTIPKAAE